MISFPFFHHKRASANTLMNAAFAYGYFYFSSNSFK